MTTTNKPTRRETLSQIRLKGFRPLIIELNTTYLKVRPKGTRQYYTVTYDQIYTLGARNAAEEARQAKIEARRARRPRGF